MATRLGTARPRKGQDHGTAADVMTRAVGTCSPLSTVTEASLLLRASNGGAVPVVEDGKPIGIVTDRDLAVALAAHPDLPQRPVSEIMSDHVVVVAPDTPLEELAGKFADAPGRRVLAVADDERFLGLIDWSDLAGRLPRRDFRRVVSGLVGRAWVAGPEGTRKPSPVEEDRHSLADWWRPAEIRGLFATTFDEWMRDKVPQLGAALAFYTLLSLAPLLLIAIAVASFAFGEQAARGQIMGQIQELVGTEGAEAIQNMIAGAQQPKVGGIAATIGLATLLFAASGVFAQLQDSMNTIWEVQAKPGRGIWGTIQDRFLSFVMVLGTGFLLLVSLILSAVVSAFTHLAAGIVPGLAPAIVLGNFAVSFVVFALLFAMIFKVLPDVEVTWRDTLVGAVVTTVLFLIGKSVLGVYFARGAFGTTYGAAASIVILLTWIYYTAQILFFGAEFTKAFANRFGSKVVPTPNAEPVTEEARAQQGLAEAGAPG